MNIKQNSECQLVKKYFLLSVADQVPVSFTSVHANGFFSLQNHSLCPLQNSNDLLLSNEITFQFGIGQEVFIGI